MYMYCCFTVGGSETRGVPGAGHEVTSQDRRPYLLWALWGERPIHCCQKVRIKNFPSCFMSSLYPPWTKFRGVYRNHSVCPSVCSDACPTQNLFCFDIGFPNWHMGHSWSRDWHRHTKLDTWLYHHETTCCVHSWPVYDFDL